MAPRRIDVVTCLALACVAVVAPMACANSPAPIPLEVDDAAAPRSDAGSASREGGRDAAPPKPQPDEVEEEVAKPGLCASEATYDTCMDCCITAHEQGAETFYGALIDCICQPANCQADCERSLCDPFGPSQPDFACEQCANAKIQSCQAPVATACSADPDCIAFDACVGDSDCLNKP